MRLGAQPFCENEFYLHENEKSFPYQRRARTLVLKQRPGGTRKWRIVIYKVSSSVRQTITYKDFVNARKPS